MIERENRCHSERGVLVPLLAVIALPVIIFVAMLGYRPLYYRTIRDTLEVKADEAVRLLGNQALFPGEVAERLSKLVNSNFFDPFDQMRIQSVRLIAPTMPDPNTVAFSNYSCPESPLTPGPGSAMVEWGWFGSLNITPCSLDSGADCQFIGSTCNENLNVAGLPAPQYVEQFPPSLFDRAAHAGSAVSLVITVQPQNLFFYSLHPVVKDITVRVSFTSEVKGYSHGNVYTGQAERAEVVMILGPQAKVETDFGLHPQFQVASTDYDTIFEDVARGASDWYDPLNASDTFSAPLQPRPVANNLWWAGTNLGLAGLAVPTGPAELDRLRVKCSNPGVIARQAVTGTLANLFSRNGTTRKAMSVYYARAQHRPRRASYGGNFADPTQAHNTLPDLLNPPVTISRWGMDTTQPTLVHPTESFWAGAEGDPEYSLPVAFGGGIMSGVGSYDPTAPNYPDGNNGLRRRGWIQPLMNTVSATQLWEEDLSSSPATAVALMAYHSAVSLQSAICDHLYVNFGDLGANDTLYYDQTHALRKLRSKSIIPNYYDPGASIHFEGDEYEYAAGTLVLNDRDNEPRFSRNGRTPNDWIQPCHNLTLPSTDPESAPCPNQIDHGRRLDEILFTLGTVEMCPLRRDWIAQGAAPLGDFCQAGGPTNPNHDLSPDIAAALYAAVKELRAAGIAYNWSSGGSGGAYTVPGNFEPLAPGGIFPLKRDPSFTPVAASIDPMIYDGPAYHQVAANDPPSTCAPTSPRPAPCPGSLNMGGPIIIVTHQYPKGEFAPVLTNEARQLGSMVNELNSLGRPVFWLYFPLHPGQASWAKGVLGAILDVDNTRNRLFIAHPEAASPSLPDTPAGLADYYRFFLSDLGAGSPLKQNAADMAWEVYTQAMNYETKL